MSSLNQSDIDSLGYDIKVNNISPEIYYIAHKIETREGAIDESFYKSKPEFTIIPIEIGNIHNAYFDYLNFINNPNDYHTETETEYFDKDNKRSHMYITENTSSPYDKDFNPRTPSIIFGVKRMSYINGEYTETIDPSPILPIYTNTLSWNNMGSSSISTYTSLLENWKYVKLDNPVEMDGETYKYATSNYYVLECKNFPRVEHILINVKEKSSYFMKLDDAIAYKKELEA